jgi:hypothetical protein
LTGKYQIIYDRLYDRKFDNTKINEYINTKKFTEVRIGLKNCLLKFLSNPRFHHINWKSEAIKDRFSKERTSLKEINGYKRKVKYLLYRYFIKMS